MIVAHGGKLINRISECKEISDMEKIELDSREASDLELIGYGGYSPLEGFMCREDYESVLDNMRLKNGIVWSLPITLATERNDLKEGDEIALLAKKKAVGRMRIEEKYRWNKEKEALKAYGTTDASHPGVRYTYSRKKFLVGGKVEITEIIARKFKHFLAPAETRNFIKKKGWKKVVAFQTRNAIHRAHEYIQKCALETCDGLMVQPLVGETKKGDTPYSLILKTYEVAIENYYNKDRVLLCVLPAAMHYAGPKEAIFHAIVRKNYGATHFIVGRDHAGVGNFYGPYDAQRIFDDFTREELGIEPIFFENAFYCKRCGSMATHKTCSHDRSEHIVFTGTMVRETLRSGNKVPEEVLRKEVYELLKEYYNKN
jgi:sulfate adenylyltransferase (EC 2.7.7.4)